MPRVGNQKTDTRRYGSASQDDDLNEALKEIAAGKSQRDVAKRYNIFRGLQNKSSKNHS